MKLLFFGDLAATGFGTVTADLGRELLALDVDVRFVSQNELGSLPEPFASRTLDLLTYVHTQPDATGQGGVDPTQVPAFIPRVLTGDGFGLSFYNGEPWGDWKPDAVLLLGDFYGVRFVVEPHLEAFQSLPSFHYVPIEGVGLPPRWKDLWNVIQPVAMSGFGQIEIAKVTGTLPPLIYHGVDTDVFHPVSPTRPLKVQVDNGEFVTLQSKEACKAFFGMDPRKTVIFRADRHMPRKGYNGLLRAMSPVLESHPLAALVIHCAAFDQGGNLWDSVSKLPPTVQSQIAVTNMRGVPREVLVAMYNAADLYVSTSAEGFGLTIAEALACGVPAVGLDYSAVPEVIGPAGMVVPVASLYDNEYDHFWAVPDEAKFGAAVAYLLDHPSRRRSLGALGPKHVAKSFRWDAAAEVFRGIVEASVGLSDGSSDPQPAERVLVAA